MAPGVSLNVIQAGGWKSNCFPISSLPAVWPMIMRARETVEGVVQQANFLAN